VVEAVAARAAVLVEDGRPVVVLLDELEHRVAGEAAGEADDGPVGLAAQPRVRLGGPAY
jgi:hypothetical protein